MKWSYVSPYFHLSVWLFSLTLLSVWLWELRARNVTPKNIPATFLLMTVSLALALLNSCVFLFFGSSNELQLGVGRANTHQWMCAMCGIIAIVGQYLVRVSVWAFFIVRGSLVTSFNARLNRIARATPYVLSAHACLFVVLCALFVDVGKGHSDHSEMCHVRDFPLWLLFVGPMAGDLFYGFGFFVIFYSTMRSSFLQTMKSLSMRERMATQRHLRRNLVLFMLQLLSAIGTYVLILSMNFSFTSFELAEMNAAITNMCLFALFRGRVKVYTCCSRVLCPEIHENLMRHEEVQCELRSDEAKKRRAAIEALRKKEKEMEAKRKTKYVIEVEPLRGFGDAHTDDHDSVEDSIDLIISSKRMSSLSIFGDDSVLCNPWSAVHSRMGTALGMFPIVDMSLALGTTIAMGVTPPPSPIPRTPIVESKRFRGSSNPKSKQTRTGKVQGRKHIRAATADTSTTMFSKADKVLGVSQALGGAELTELRELFLNRSLRRTRARLNTIVSISAISMESSSLLSTADYKESESQSSDQSSSYDHIHADGGCLKAAASMPPMPRKSPVATMAIIPPDSRRPTAAVAVGRHTTIVTSMISTPISMESTLLSADSYVSQLSTVEQSSSYDDSEDDDDSSYELLLGQGIYSGLGTTQSMFHGAKKTKSGSSLERPKRRNSLSTMTLTSSIKSRLATTSSFKEMFEKVKALRGKRASESGSVLLADGSQDAVEIEPLSPVSGNGYEEEFC